MPINETIFEKLFWKNIYLKFACFLQITYKLYISTICFFAEFFMDITNV